MSETLLFETAREARFNRTELNNALRDGKIRKAGWCLLCGQKTELEAHHSRYGRKCGLVVAWLCPVCHVFGDARKRSRERFGSKPFAWDEESVG